MATDLDRLTSLLEGLPADQFNEVVTVGKALHAHKKWVPNAGPQSEAYYCKADVLLYGGQAAGGKSDLLCGLALEEHTRTLVMRRQYTDLGFLIERTREIDGSWKGFNGSPPPRLRTEDGRVIDFGAAAKVGDERHWQGQPHDLLAMDEVVHFVESQVRFLMGWVRTTDTNQRARTIFASNPPETAEGDFIIGMFRPWLDITHHNPAKPGELRWYVTDPDGKDFEVDGPEPYQFPGDKEPVMPLSRTFIPASLKDNPFQRNTGYDAQLDALPEPLRSLMRDGNFMAGREDDIWQLIPTVWIQEAQARWTPMPPPGVPMSCMAIDPASGGPDKSTISMRYDWWYDNIIEKPGRETPMGTEIAGLVVMHRKNNCPVVIDMGGGYGGVPFTTLQANGIEPVAYKGAEGSNARTIDRKLGFFNKRTETYWKFREALDPAQLGGSPIALPPDQELLSELTSMKFKAIPYKGVLTIQAEAKTDVIARLGRSTDKSDGVVMAWSAGDATLLGQIIQKDQRIGGRGGRMPKTVTSKTHKSNSRRPNRR